MLPTLNTAKWVSLLEKVRLTIAVSLQPKLQKKKKKKESAKFKLFKISS